MAKSNSVVRKKGRGRPATGQDPVTAIRLSPDLTARIDAFVKANGIDSRSEAMRHLLELGLQAPKRKTSKLKGRSA
jgi:metal-responsive CopG/Arc/MetJ family transcriptional regulator